jgi:deoxycytidylate deaminase
VNWTRNFQVAKIASLQSSARKARRVGAALYSGGTLLSIGYNEYGHSHPDAPWNLHAEHRALLKRQYYDDKGRLIMYVWRALASGAAANSKPCENCTRLMREAGIRLVRFVNEAGRFEEMKI